MGWISSVELHLVCALIQVILVSRQPLFGFAFSLFCPLQKKLFFHSSPFIWAEWLDLGPSTIGKEVHFLQMVDL
jgi:hypothetical protein